MSRAQVLLLGVLAAIAVTVGVWIGVDEYGNDRYEAGYSDAVDAGRKAVAAAMLTRTQENAAQEARQAASNATITEKKNEEIQPVRERIVTRRVYVGSALCGGGPSAPAEAQSAASSDKADSPGRLVRSDVERDIVALKLAVEEDLATGRACQAILKDEGMVP